MDVIRRKRLSSLFLKGAFFGFVVATCGCSVALNAEVVARIDLGTLGGHAIVPRPRSVPIPYDLGKEDLLLQDVLQKAQFRLVETKTREIELDVDGLLHQRGHNPWNSVTAEQFPALRDALRRKEAVIKNVTSISKAAVNHEIGTSTAATLFAHMMKQRHIWARPVDLAVAGAANLHYLSWNTAIRVLEAGAGATLPNLIRHF